MNKIIIIFCLLYIQIQSAVSQVDTSFIKNNITFQEYLEKVSSSNLEYAAEKYNVTISDAAIEAAKVIPDPSVSFDWIDYKEAGTRTGYEFTSGIGMTIELGGKRRARINLAKSEAELTKAQLTDYFRNLRADATLIYLDALKQKQFFGVGLSSYKTMKQLAEADSIRFKLGSITQIDAEQTKLEAGILLNDLILSATEWKNSLGQIALMTGNQSSTDTLYHPASKLHDIHRIFSLDELITASENNRADLLAAMLQKKVSENELKLVRRERMTDMDISVGSYNEKILDGVSPGITGISGGIAVPLKFSNFSRGDIKMAKARMYQSEELYNLVENQIRTEIIAAWNLYYVYCSQVDNFENGLLKLASDVLRGKIYSYQRGETSLLEVLNAQRTYNDIQVAYYEAFFNQAAALVNLEKSAGIWDLNL